jgi:hypothetical protein
MTDTYFGKEVALTSHHNNAAIKINVLDESKMRDIGFTDFRPDTWYFCKYNVGHPDISFSLSVEKNNPENWEIDILDENFLQPYDYQMMLERGTQNPLPFLCSYPEDQSLIPDHATWSYCSHKRLDAPHSRSFPRYHLLLSHR